MQNGHQTSPADGPKISPFDKTMLLGVICESGLSSVKIRLAVNNGRAASCDIGQYALIKDGNFAIFSRVENVRMEAVAGQAQEREPIATVALLSTLSLADGEVSSGVKKTPPIGTMVFNAHPELIKIFAEARGRQAGEKPKVSLDLAVLDDPHRTPVTITPEMLFGRHMAILGTTGAGKSFTLARLVEEVGKHRSKLILFDAAGEFGLLDTNTLHVYLGNHPRPPKNFFQVSVPYYELIENDLFAIFRPTGEGQAPKLRQAIKTLKLVRLAPHVGFNGTVLKANREKKIFEEAAELYRKELESPAANFEISDLVSQINNECVNPYRSALEPGFWGDINGLALSQCTALVNRVQDIIGSANLAPIFQPGNCPSLFTVIDRFLADEDYSVLCISLQYLSFEHHAREIVANAAARYLLDLARNEKFQQRPMLVVVDEAHHFLNENLEAGDLEFPLDAFALIAKEGRKYCLHICIATQRPRDIPESVLSQMGTLIVHRLINDKDRQIIERASGEADSSSLAALPSFGSGQAVLLGAAFPAPFKVVVNLPKQPPTSRSADFQKFWDRESEDNRPN